MFLYLSTLTITLSFFLIELSIILTYLNVIVVLPSLSPLNIYLIYTGPPASSLSFLDVISFVLINLTIDSYSHLYGTPPLVFNVNSNSLELVVFAIIINNINTSIITMHIIVLFSFLLLHLYTNFSIN